MVVSPRCVSDLVSPLCSLSWVDSPSELQLEGSKVRSEDLVSTLHKVMTARPFPREPAHRVLIVFSPTDQVRESVY